MYEGVNLSIYLLLPRGMDLILPCLNYVPVHVTSLALLYLVCTVPINPVHWALIMNVI